MIRVHIFVETSSLWPFQFPLSYLKLDYFAFEYRLLLRLLTSLSWQLPLLESWGYQTRFYKFSLVPTLNVIKVLFSSDCKKYFLPYVQSLFSIAPQACTVILASIRGKFPRFSLQVGLLVFALLITIISVKFNIQARYKCICFFLTG